MGRMSEISAEGKLPAALRGAARGPLAGRAGGAQCEGHPSMSEERSSPATNRGELEAPAIAGHSDVQLVMTDSGELKTIAVRVPTNGQIAVIDGLRLVIGEETFLPVVDGVDDEAFVRAASAQLEEIFGFGLTRNLGQRRDFYGETWELGDNWGHVGFGGERQNSTILIALSGQGTLAAKGGWEARLYQFLTTKAKRPVITRADLAHDCFEGEVTVEQLDQMHTDGFFTNAYTIPDCQHAGNWKFPNGKGRTLYVGTRKAGKMFRGYEKGMEQGDSTSPWVRLETELSNKSMVIPFDVLLDPSAYFMGSYPKAFAHLSLTVAPERLEIKRRSAEISLDASIKMVNTQVGKYIGVIVDYFGMEEAVAMLRNKLGQWPERLKVPDYMLADTPVHRQERMRSFNEYEFGPSDYSGALEAAV
ncbi:Phage replication protein [Cupriavidus taiwanensis]|uniref:replication initiation factor domain-containing protein n=1 Tax=Cupriavidus taiwanensis TaxID=164546 RepID=UPI000E1733C7|nr:replication initiation factor domain-containing protein [Cupriavidus taiwanensis]SPA23019.1 Phage replication protein [Cupriavidus taiwanensis]